MPLIFGIDTIVLDPATTKGVVPIGTVMSVMSDIAGGFTIPATGVVDGGFMLCDGAAVPGGQGLTGNTPDMTGDIYLRGSAVAGVAAGANSKSLNTPQLPTHAHPGASTAANAPHSHTANAPTANAPHGHSASPNSHVYASANAPHAHDLSRASAVPQDVLASNVKTVNTGAPNMSTQTSNTPHNQPHNTPAGSVPGNNAPHTHTVPITTNNAPHSHTVTVGSTGAGDSFDIQPNYITCQYIIRVA